MINFYGKNFESLNLNLYFEQNIIKPIQSFIYHDTLVLYYIWRSKYNIIYIMYVLPCNFIKYEYNETCEVEYIKWNYVYITSCEEQNHFAHKIHSKSFEFYQLIKSVSCKKIIVNI